MRYYKQIEGEYIVAIGTGVGGEEITQEEFSELLSLVRSKPTAEEGYDYKLRKDLAWEIYKLPIEEVSENENTDI